MQDRARASPKFGIHKCGRKAMAPHIKESSTVFKPKKAIYTEAPRARWLVLARIVSIGIVAHNEEKSIPATLRNILLQAKPKGFETEIIICDNASTDRTAEVVRKIAEKRPAANIKLVSEPRLGMAHAMNKVKESSAGEIIVFCNADVRVHGVPAGKKAPQKERVLERRRGLAKLVEYLEKHPKIAAVAAEPMQLQRKLHKVGRAPKRTLLNLMLSVAAKQRPMPLLYGALWACRKAELPRFPDIAALDVWLSAKLGRDRIAVHPHVRVYHRAPTTCGDLLRGDVRRVRAELKMRALGKDSVEVGDWLRRRYGWFGPDAKGLSLAERLAGVTALKALGLFSRTAAVKKASSSSWKTRATTKRGPKRKR
jgi:hypothetical protein